MRLKHYDHDGRVRFITFCTHKRLPLLADSGFCDIVLQTLLGICTENSVDILAFVIMPDHIHIVINPPSNLKVGPFVGEMKRRSAKTILKVLRSRKAELLESLLVNRDGVSKQAVWQRRCFDRNCRSDVEILKAVEYCHQNPVSRGLVVDPIAWKWSSYAWYAED